MPGVGAKAPEARALSAFSFTNAKSKQVQLQVFLQEIYGISGPEKTKYCFNVSKST